MEGAESAEWPEALILLAIAGAYRGWTKIWRGHEPGEQMLFKGLGFYLLAMTIYYGATTAETRWQFAFAVCMPIGAVKAAELIATAAAFLVQRVLIEIMFRQRRKGR